MSAQKKLENLTDSWYGFALFTAIINVLTNGLGIFSLLFTAGSLLFSLLVTFLIGRRLQKRAKLTRLVLVVLSAISTVTGTLGVFKFGSEFLASWSFSGLLHLVAIAAGVMMAVRSFRTLTDNQVKSFFA